MAHTGESNNADGEGTVHRILKKKLLAQGTWLMRVEAPAAAIITEMFITILYLAISAGQLTGLIAAIAMRYYLGLGKNHPPG